MGLTMTALTPADLMTLPIPENGHGYELSDGDLIVVGSAGARHGAVKSRILTALVAWKLRFPLCAVYSESMFRLGEHTARIPDVAVLLADKVARMPDEDIPIPFGPDLAAEVVSASESARDAEKKVREYLAAGVGEVWQVYPDQQVVLVRRVGEGQDFEGSAVLRSGVLEGFEVEVSKFFMN